MSASRRLRLYPALAAAAFLAALVLGRPELAALGAPFALALAAGLALPPPEEVHVSLRPARERAVEGEELDAALVVAAPARAQEVDVALLLPDGIRAAGGARTLRLHLAAGEERRLPLRLACDRFGAYRPDDLLVRSRDALGLRVLDRRLTGEAVLRVYPRAERLRELVAPLETQPFAGNRVARPRGEGIEFADVRPYVPGDRAGRINWRRSALRQALYVNEQHPERNGDAIVFLDSFAEAGRDGESTLDLAVRAAASLADGYLAERDRVGLVSFGGVLRWLTPASGARQLHRIVDALLETEVLVSFAWKDVDVLPARSLTPHALVVALSPLLDERGVRALLDLRGRGFDLVVVELDPLAFALDGGPASGELARRLWRLQREALRFRYERAGVPVVGWDGRRPLAAAVEEVRAFRRSARRASA